MKKVEKVTHDLNHVIKGDHEHEDEELESSCDDSEAIIEKLAYEQIQFMSKGHKEHEVNAHNKGGYSVKKRTKEHYDREERIMTKLMHPEALKKKYAQIKL